MNTRNLRSFIVAVGVISVCSTAVMAQHPPVPPPEALMMSANVDRGGAWLGVQLAPVPEALASHLRLEGKGVMVANVAEDSPADAAGLQQFDVLVTLDGEPVSAALNEFADQIREKPEDATIKLELIRGGETQTVSAPLAGDRPSEPPGWKYAPPRGPMFHDTFDFRGKILRPLPDGGFEMQDLSQLPEWEKIAPLLIPEMRPGPKGKRFERHMPFFFKSWTADKGGQERMGKWTSDGVTTEVRVAPDGKITVTTSEEGSDAKESKEYATAEELEQDNPQAYAYYQKLCEMRRLPAPECVPGQGASTFEQLKEWQDIFRDRLDEMERQADEFKDRAEQWRKEREAYQDDLRAWQERFERRFGPQDAKPGADTGARRSMTFSVDPAGRIDVTLRKGDSEVHLQFEDEAQLEQKDPELYAQFQRIRGRAD